MSERKRGKPTPLKDVVPTVLERRGRSQRL